MSRRLLIAVLVMACSLAVTAAPGCSEREKEGLCFQLQDPLLPGPPLTVAPQTSPLVDPQPGADGSQGAEKRAIESLGTDGTQGAEKRAVGPDTAAWALVGEPIPAADGAQGA
ncbi:hypothetical protein OE88DRAFT_1643206 [Heliocybe sulcata]|uniref:Uncharacterized protein n=1 Tax=Heliocybe sulcata TaxID=5364 RepID=A0A5C3N8M3_9AGAM|nr:hypothetical protein OE88DRAFT_1643206 [Heliocybe sulcata]